MLFNSLPFLLGFLPVTYIVFWLLRGRQARFVWLTFTGYVFYGFWNWRFCFLMAFSTAVSYWAGRGLLASDDPRRRRLLLVVPITVDLLLLGFFKYANFTVDSAARLLSSIGVQVHPPAWHIILPIGISFYTFHTISYVVDAYRRTITPTRNFFEFSCYVSLFSQLVAGPIVRFRQIESDLEGLDHARRRDGLDIGASFFILGLAQKVLLADTLASIVDNALKDPSTLSTAGAWLAALGYTYQLYFDFAGYSNMAVGLGHLFGVRIPQNFNSPYKADGIADFWRRWHISLSSCLRDYVYIPLGGGRGGSLATARNLMVTMLIGGLWHGAGWTFVAWGGYHGVLLVLERKQAAQWARVPIAARRTLTFIAVVIGWVLFRSTSFGMARTWLSAMGVPTSGALPSAMWGLSLALAVAAALAHTGPNTFEMRHDWKPATACALALLFALSMFMIYAGQHSPFLYFQF